LLNGKSRRRKSSVYIRKASAMSAIKSPQIRERCLNLVRKEAELGAEGLANPSGSG
jgi:hypothetical protein